MSQHRCKVCGHKCCQWNYRSYTVLPETLSDIFIIFRHISKIAETDS